MKQAKTKKQPAPDPMRSREPLKHARLGFIAIWIITITCMATNLFVLKNPVLMISTIPILVFIAWAQWSVSRARAAVILEADKARAKSEQIQNG
jgi:hypothetical protein